MTVMDTLVKLMNKAEDAEKLGNHEEAITYMEKVTQLCMKKGIDEALVRTTLTEQNDKDVMVHEVIEIGERKQRGLRNRAIYVTHIINNIVGTKCNLYSDGHAIIVYGTKEQFKRAETLAKSVLIQNEQGIKFGKKSAREQGERFNRISYDEGYFEEMLQLARNTAKQREDFIKDNIPDDAIEESNHTVEHKQALALRSMELEVQDYYNKTSNARGTFQGSRSRTPGYASYQAGREQGRGSNLSGQRALSA